MEELYRIGDSVAPRKVDMAIWEGHKDREGDLMDATAKFSFLSIFPPASSTRPAGGSSPTGSRLAGILDTPWGAVVPVAPAATTLAGFGAFGAPAVTLMEGGTSVLDTPALLGQSFARLATEGAGRRSSSSPTTTWAPRSPR